MDDHHEHFDILPELSLALLKDCYRFVNEEWQHLTREALPDQGFELRFRERCVRQFPDWRISQQRELHLGGELDTASGTDHEVDTIATHPEVISILELKNRRGSLPTKNDVIVFFAKILDYVAGNPPILLKDVCPVFMSAVGFEASGLAACLGLGVHPIAPHIRPIPMLANNMRRFMFEQGNGAVLHPTDLELFSDFRARLNRMCSILRETWFSARFGYYSEETILVRAVSGIPTLKLSQELRQLNADCSRLISCFQAAKAGTAA
jgi:hypothetical protein